MAAIGWVVTTGLDGLKVAVSDSPALIVHASWPTITTCDGATSVAMPVGGAPPTQVLKRTTKGTDFRVSAAASGGGAYQRGYLTLVLSAHTGRTANILNIRPVVFRSTAASPAWVSVVQGGCGDAAMRLLDLSLDPTRGARLTDKGVVDYSGTGQPLTHLKAQPLGPTFTVTATDTTDVTVEAHMCTQGEVDFGLEIEYDDDGVTRTYSLGSSEDPYRVLGGEPGEVAVDGVLSPGTQISAC